MALSFKTRQRLVRALWRFRPLIQYVRYGKPNPIEPWDDDGEFRNLLVQVQDHTLVDKVRCHLLYQLLQQALVVDGDLAEIGVYRGGTAKLIATVAEGSNKTLHLFDTFEGMPRTDADRDWHQARDFDDTSLEAVKAFLGDLPGLEFHPGIFPDSAASLSDRKFCFVHVDADIHESVHACCEYFYPRLSPGGVLLFDDYGHVTCEGAKQAVDDFFATRPEVPLYLPYGQAAIFKLA